jgi:glycosyltransferase involved in cell wall biosynthesis
MRILFVTPCVPSPLRVRPWQFLRHLAARGHAMSLLVVARPGERRDSLDDLREWCSDVTVVPVLWAGAMRNCLLSLPGPMPLNAAFFASPEARRRLARLDTSKFDLVHLDHLRTAQYAPLLNGLPRLYDAVDCMTLLWSRAAQVGGLRGRVLAAWELWKTRRYERRALGWMDGVVVTSEVDAAALRDMVSQSAVRTVSNGVDSDYFRPGPDLSDGRTLVFLGNMRYHANVNSICYFVREAMPLLWRQSPRCRLVIVGTDPVAEVRALARDARITVTGYVKDVRPYLSRATVGVCPIVYGAGVQNKALEFMASGLPVVVSPQVCSGLKAEPGQDLIVAEEPGEWVGALMRLLASPRERRRLSTAGRAYVVRHHSWEKATLQLEQAYDEVISRRAQALAA